tara:strand:+ start:260 stop:1129 length:870 start_codon:yes stop_codon:yes gene_type:complete
MNSHSINGNLTAERVFNFSIVMVATFAIGMVVAHGQEITKADLLHGPPSCGHVINQVNRYGVNQSFDRAANRKQFHHSPYGSMMIPIAEMGDLEIVSVHQMVHADPGCGPRIAVVIANHSNRCVDNFSVTAVATLGRMHPFSPNQTVTVATIQPRAAFQVELTLPLESLAMGNRNGQVIGFQRLVIAIDSFDELAETDEANNIKAYVAALLPILETTTAVETMVEPQSDVTQSDMISSAVGVPTAEAPGPSGPSASGPATTGSAGTDALSDPLRSAISQFDTASAASGS